MKMLSQCAYVSFDFPLGGSNVSRALRTACRSPSFSQSFYDINGAWAIMLVSHRPQFLEPKLSMTGAPLSDS